MKVRRATDDDVPALVRLINAAFLAEAPFLSGDRASAEEIHRVYSVVFHSRFAAVTSTDAWIAAVKGGQRIERDNIMASNQRGRAARAG